ncbi:hypothetical protein LTR86_003803 [Recurvomyces mirabilis]|nr:hypothetical protein LTR86_003803 [Recurvomyces mirabilis]
MRAFTPQRVNGWRRATVGQKIQELDDYIMERTERMVPERHHDGEEEDMLIWAKEIKPPKSKAVVRRQQKRQSVAELNLAEAVERLRGLAKDQAYHPALSDLRQQGDVQPPPAASSRQAKGQLVGDSGGFVPNESQTPRSQVARMSKAITQADLRTGEVETKLQKMDVSDTAFGHAERIQSLRTWS